MSRPAPSTDGRVHVGIDIGGTFTDIIAYDPAEAAIHVTKVPSTPNSPAAAVSDGLDRLLDETPHDPADLATIAHGSTVTINALIEREGACTAILLTEGFDAIPVARRGDRPESSVTNPRYQSPEPLVPHRRVREVPERVDADGTVLTPLDEAAVRSIVTDLRDAGVESIAVCYLFSFLNPVHERRTAALIDEIHPDCAVTLSSEIAPRIREFPRLSTTVVGAYVDPLLRSYLTDLEARLAAKGIDPAALSMMLSHGGLANVSEATASPASTPLSGPAAGVQGAIFAASQADVDHIVTLDMGGTSCDIAIAFDLEPFFSTEKEIVGNPITVPMVDVQAIGAGGGTIAQVEGGRLLVGPQSAGADPGPVCYGRGGERVTVTDANLVLGRLNPDIRLGGDLEIDPDAAKRAIQEQIADPLDLTVLEAAAGVLDIVTTTMKKELRLALTEEGEDPRRYALVAFGGAGPMHAPEIARELAINRVVVPRFPGITSAVGLLTTDRKRIYERSRVEPLETAAIDAMFEELRKDARSDVGTADPDAVDAVSDDKLSFRSELELRYAGQSYELPIAVDIDDSAADLRNRFDQVHESTFGHVSDQPVETMTYRVTAIQATETLTGEVFRELVLSGDHGETADPTHTPRTRSVFFDGSFIETAIYDRTDLTAGTDIVGPAIVEQADTTTVLDPHTRATVDAAGNLVLTFEAVDR